MFYQHRRRFAFALAVCLLFGLLPGTSRAEPLQTEPVADTPAAETVETNVPAVEMPTDTYEVIEAEQVSLSESEIRVIKGGTTTLTAELPEAERGESPLTTSSTIVWTSSNPEVATVDSNGVVTGVDLGEAIITATLNGSVLETFTVYSTFSDGYYVFATLDYSQYLCTDELSMGNSVGMYLLPSWYLDSDEAGTAENIGRKWYLDYQNDGYYIIYPAYSTGMALCLLNGSDPSVCPLGTTTPYARQWKIINQSYYYVIQNREYANVYLSFSDTEDFSPVVGETSNSASDVQGWNIESAFASNGLLLFDTLSGQLVDNTWDTESVVRVAYLPKNTPRSLANLGLYVRILDFTSTSMSYSMSFNSSSVSFNSSTLRITGTSDVSTTATISKTISGITYNVSFPLVVYSNTNSITVMYDHAYIYRHSNAISRINSINQLVTQKFATTYGIVLSFTMPVPFNSYGDSCDNDHFDACDCATYDLCSNSHRTPNANADPPMHHKNAYNILHTTAYSSNAMRLTFIGHHICYAGDFGHIEDTEDSHTLYGLASPSKNLAQVHDHTNASSITHEACNAFHEVGHLFGAPDHYGNAVNGWTLEQLDNYDEDDTTNLFSDACIYGDDKDDPDIINNITVCTGCTKVIRGEIILPDKPPTTTS